MLLGIDLGTTGCKAAVYSVAGEPLGESYLECPLIKPSPGVVEQDAALWWDLTREAIHQALGAANVDGYTVRALSVSSQGISFVPVDESGRPLSNAISWLDTRATAEVETVLNRYSEADLFAITGKRASPAYVLPKLLWLRHHQPELYQRASKFLMAHDYLLCQLTGQFVTDPSMAAGTLLYDISRLQWSQELLAAFEISEERLPEIKWAGTFLGQIRPEVARELGLSEEAMVIVGGQDQKCAALGAGIRPGAATVSLGTATAITCVTDHPVLDPQRRIPVFPFVRPGKWALEGVVGTSGAALKWLLQTFFPGQSYRKLDELAAGSPPGSNGLFFYPHLMGATSPHWRTDVWGAFLGLTLAVGPGDMVRSILEGIAFQIRSNLKVIEEMGIPVEELILFGGGAQSSLWSQIISDVTGKPVVVTPTVDVATWGACILAGLGVGVLTNGDLERLAARGGRSRLYPQPEAVRRYEEVYHHYTQQEEKLMMELH